MKLEIRLSEEEKQKVLKARFNHPSPKVQMRLEALYLRSLGKSYWEIKEIIGCSHASLARWFKIYVESGLDGFMTIEFYRPSGVLEEHRGTLEDYFRMNPPSSVREAVVRIHEMTGVQRSETVIRKFLRSIGMSYRKTGRVPGKANRKAQDEFKKKAWSLF